MAVGTFLAVTSLVSAIASGGLGAASLVQNKNLQEEAQGLEKQQRLDTLAQQSVDNRFNRQQLAMESKNVAQAGKMLRERQQLAGREMALAGDQEKSSALMGAIQGTGGGRAIQSRMSREQRVNRFGTPEEQSRLL